jgi:hypothetical protein
VGLTKAKYPRYNSNFLGFGKEHSDCPVFYNRISYTKIKIEKPQPSKLPKTGHGDPG